jgi:predicted metal-dependent hydrolase
MDERLTQSLMQRLNADAERIARRFGLRYKDISAERAGVKRRYGICFADGSIRIRLRHTLTGRSLKYSSLVNTLCHELAHLRHFNHGLRFRAFYAQLLEYARREGIYQPGCAQKSAPAAPPRWGEPPAPRPRKRLETPDAQLTLF